MTHCLVSTLGKVCLDKILIFEVDIVAFWAPGSLTLFCGSGLPDTHSIESGSDSLGVQDVSFNFFISITVKRKLKNRSAIL